MQQHLNDIVREYVLDVGGNVSKKDRSLKQPKCTRITRAMARSQKLNQSIADYTLACNSSFAESFEIEKYSISNTEDQTTYMESNSTLGVSSDGNTINNKSSNPTEDKLLTKRQNGNMNSSGMTSESSGAYEDATNLSYARKSFNLRTQVERITLNKTDGNILMEGEKLKDNEKNRAKCEIQKNKNIQPFNSSHENSAILYGIKDQMLCLSLNGLSDMNPTEVPEENKQLAVTSCKNVGKEVALRRTRSNSIRTTINKHSDVKVVKSLEKDHTTYLEGNSVMELPGDGNAKNKSSNFIEDKLRKNLRVKVKTINLNKTDGSILVKSEKFKDKNSTVMSGMKNERPYLRSKQLNNSHSSLPEVLHKSKDLAIVSCKKVGKEVFATKSCNNNSIRTAIAKHSDAKILKRLGKTYVAKTTSTNALKQIQIQKSIKNTTLLEELCIPKQANEIQKILSKPLQLSNSQDNSKKMVSCKGLKDSLILAKGKFGLQNHVERGKKYLKAIEHDKENLVPSMSDQVDLNTTYVIEDNSTKCENKENAKEGAKTNQYNFDMLHTDDSTDEECKTSKKRTPPAWSRRRGRNPLLKMQKFVDLSIIDSLFSVGPKFINVQDIFTSIKDQNYRRESSLVWKSPVEYSQMPKY